MSTSFIYSINYSVSLSPSTETVTKFFRSQGSSLNNTPKKTHPDDNTSFKDFVEDDAISAGSIDSNNVSIHSYQSSSLAAPHENDEIVTVIAVTETEADPISQSSPDHHTVDIGTLHTESIKFDESTESLKSREISIGSIYDQFLIEYVVRVVCYKFLLTGQEQKLKCDNVVRVSIKNLSLIVLSDCVRMYPEILMMKLTVPRKENVSDECREKMFEDLSELCLAEKSECKDDQLLLDIIPDHFGTSTCSLEEFLSPLSDSGCADPSKSVSNATKTPSKAAVISNLIVNDIHDSEILDKFDQNIEDILLYFNHHDPSLRCNVQSIIGNFIVAVLEDHRSVDEFCEKFVTNAGNKFIHTGLLLKVLMQVKRNNFL